MFERLSQLISEIERLAGEGAGLDQLQQTLAETRREVARLSDICPEASAGSAVIPPEHDERPILDKAFVLRQYPNGLGVYARLVALFSTDVAAKAKSIRERLAAGRLEEAHRLAHSLVGITATLGAARASLTSRRLEQLLKAGQGGEDAVLLLDKALREAELAEGAMRRLLVGEEPQA